MKRNKLLLSALLCGAVLLLAAGCEDFSYPGVRPGNYTSVANKTLSVDLTGIDTIRMTAAMQPITNRPKKMPTLMIFARIVRYFSSRMTAGVSGALRVE